MFLGEHGENLPFSVKRFGKKSSVFLLYNKFVGMQESSGFLHSGAKIKNPAVQTDSGV